MQLLPSYAIAPLYGATTFKSKLTQALTGYSRRASAIASWTPLRASISPSPEDSTGRKANPPVRFTSGLAQHPTVWTSRTA